MPRGETEEETMPIGAARATDGADELAVEVVEHGARQPKVVGAGEGREERIDEGKISLGEESTCRHGGSAESGSGARSGGALCDTEECSGILSVWWVTRCDGGQVRGGCVLGESGGAPPLSATVFFGSRCREAG